MTDPAGLIECEREFLDALRRRQAELGISYETIDGIAGFSPSYTAKLLSGSKRMGQMSMWVILQVLGFRIALIDDPAAVQRIKEHGLFKPLKRRRFNLRSIARRRNAPWLWDSERARKAALKRWHKPQIDEIAG
jgi:hypothetical protein